MRKLQGLSQEGIAISVSSLLAGVGILATAIPSLAQSAMTPWVCWACGGTLPTSSAPIYASPGFPSYYPNSSYTPGFPGGTVVPGVVVTPGTVIRGSSRPPIVNSTLINPTIVNSPIYNSTLINPTIVNPPRPRQYPLFDVTQPNPIFGFPAPQY